MKKLIVLSFLFAMGCTQSRTIASNGKKILRLGNGGEPEELDPHIASGMIEDRIICAVSEGLVNPDPKTAEPTPGAAESWKISKDGRVYTFKLRPHSKWSNGDSLTADDFVFSWKRVLGPKLGADDAYKLYPLKNAEEYNKGKISDFSLVGVKAKDPQTLIVTLRAPTPYFLATLMNHTWFPVHPGTIEKFNAADIRGTKWTRPENFVSNGPFKLVKWDLNKILVVERNPQYWDAKNVKLDGIEFYPFDMAQTEERMFRTGALDKTSAIAPHKIETVKKENPKEYFNEPFLAVYYLKINIDKPQLRDVRVRRALALAIDRQSIVEKVSKAGETASFAFTPPNIGGYTSRFQLKYDIAEAQKLMADAGYPGGRGFKGIEYLFNPNEINQSLAEAIQAMWKKNLGINVTLKNVEWKVYLQTLDQHQYDVARAKWGGDYNDPNTYLNLYVTGGGNNNTGYSNPKYDSLILRANSTGDQKKRMEFFQQAEKILLTDLPIIPLFNNTNAYLLSERVKNWYPNILDYHPYQIVDLINSR